MPEQIGYLNGTPISNGVNGDSCANPEVGKKYIPILQYSAENCMWTYILEEIDEDGE